MRKPEGKDGGDGARQRPWGTSESLNDGLNTLLLFAGLRSARASSTAEPSAAQADAISAQPPSRARTHRSSLTPSLAPVDESLASAEPAATVTAAGASSPPTSSHRVRTHRRDSARAPGACAGADSTLASASLSSYRDAPASERSVASNGARRNSRLRESMLTAPAATANGGTDRAAKKPSMTERLESSIINSTIGVYLELFVAGYERLHAHRLIDVTSDGVTLFKSKRVMLRPEAIAALLLGTNQLSDVILGQIDVSFSVRARARAVVWP